MTLLSAGTWATNAELIEEVNELFPLGPVVHDVTYGRGVWWKKFRPETLHASDINDTSDSWVVTPDTFTLGSATDLDRIYPASTIALDLPYVPQSKKQAASSTLKDFGDRYGLSKASAPATPKELKNLIHYSMMAAHRALEPGGLMLVKSMPYIYSAKYHMQDVWTASTAEKLDFDIVARYVHVRPVRPQPGGRKVRSPRNNFSTLLVARRI